MNLPIKFLVLILTIVLPCKSLQCQITSINLNVSQTGIENCISGVETNFLQDDLTVFPNPTFGIFSVNLRNIESTGNLKIAVYNIHGQKIYFEDIELVDTSVKKLIDLSRYPAGTYLISITAKEKYYNAELIIK